MAMAQLSQVGRRTFKLEPASSSARTEGLKLGRGLRRFDSSAFVEERASSNPEADASKSATWELKLVRALTSFGWQAFAEETAASNTQAGGPTMKAPTSAVEAPESKPVRGLPSLGPSAPDNETASSKTKAGLSAVAPFELKRVRALTRFNYLACSEEAASSKRMRVMRVMRVTEESSDGRTSSEINSFGIWTSVTSAFGRPSPGLRAPQGSHGSPPLNGPVHAP